MDTEALRRRSRSLAAACCLALALIAAYHVGETARWAAQPSPAAAPAPHAAGPSEPPTATDPYVGERRAMVARQLAARDITDPRVLAAMEATPRHEFVPAGLRAQAYADHPLPIGSGQTISQPYIVALMTQALALNGTERVLEVGTGSGYQAAVLSPLVREVYTVEIVPELAERAQAVLARLGYANVNATAGDGYYGWPQAAPFDAIIVTAASDHVPPPLLRQLRVGGRLVIPLGDVRTYQTLTLITKTGEDEFQTDYITGVRFVPLTGGH